VHAGEANVMDRVETGYPPTKKNAPNMAILLLRANAPFI
jgi:hypothetical protein